MHAIPLETLPSIERVVSCRGAAGARARLFEVRKPVEVLKPANVSHGAGLASDEPAQLAHPELVEAQLIVVERGVSLFDAVALGAQGKATVIIARQATESVTDLIERIRGRRAELLKVGRVITRVDIFLASGHDEVWAECRSLLVALLGFPPDVRLRLPVEIAVNACVKAGRRRATRLFASVDNLLGNLDGRVTVRLRFERP